MEKVSRFEAARLTGKDPEAIRRAITRGELVEVDDDEGRRAVTYESLTRYAAARSVGTFFLSGGVLSADALDDIAPSFWAVIAAQLSCTAILRQIRADAHSMAAAGREVDARIALDWAALAEFAEIVPPTDGNGTWHVRLPAAGLVLPLDDQTAAQVREATSAPFVRPSKSKAVADA